MRPLAVVLALALLAPIANLDQAVQRQVQAARTPALERPMKLATSIGRPQLALGVLLGIAAFGGPAGAATARVAILTLVPVNLAVEGLKNAVGRTRPDGDTRRANSSFPSSHAANAFAIAAVFVARWPRAAAGLWLFAAIVAYSRMYLNRHYLSDVVFGALLGLACAWIAVKVADRRGWGLAALRSTAPDAGAPDLAGTASGAREREG